MFRVKGERYGLNSVISRDGTKITFKKSGHGPPLVLVHGSIADHRIWTSIMPAFEEHFMVVAVDRRGRGQSGDTPAYSMENEVEDLLAVIESFGEPVNLVAHSYGALCSLEAALRTGCLAKMVLYEPPIIQIDLAYRSPTVLLNKMQNYVDEGRDEEAVKCFFIEVMKRPVAEVETIRTRTAWRSMVAMAHTIPRETREVQDYTFIPRRLKKIAVPTMLLVGGNSDQLMVSVTEALHEVIPNTQVVSLEGQDHSAMNTAPELFSDEVLRFLIE